MSNIELTKRIEILLEEIEIVQTEVYRMESDNFRTETITETQNVATAIRQIQNLLEALREQCDILDVSIKFEGD